MVLKPSGDIARKQTAPAEAKAVTRSLAGGRSLPLQFRQAFWRRVVRENLKTRLCERSRALLNRSHHPPPLSSATNALMS